MKCERRTLGSELIGKLCPECGHTNIVHPGASDKLDTIDEFLVCALAQMVKEGK